jgi:hypothetical protein
MKRSALRRLALVEQVHRRPSPRAYDLRPRNRKQRRYLARKVCSAAAWEFMPAGAKTIFISAVELDAEVRRILSARGGIGGVLRRLEQALLDSGSTPPAEAKRQRNGRGAT